MTSWQTVMAQTLTQAQIFARTTAAYQSAATYQDSGEVLYQIRDSNSDWNKRSNYDYKKPFKTAFIRKTGRFSFRYRDIKRGAPANAFVGWSDGKSLKAWWAITGKVSEHKTLAGVLSGSEGVSGGSSTRGLGLLLGFDALNWNLTDLQKVVLLPQVVLAGKTCYHVQATLERHLIGATAKSSRPVKGPTESHPAIDVWIDTATFLLIRISETYNRGTESYLHTITFYPVLNQPVKSTALAFDYEHF